jgi:hypothetical protein
MRRGMERRDAPRESFEHLLLLRTCYGLRSEYDSRSTITAAEAIAYGEHLLRLVRIRERWRSYGTLRRRA